MSSAKTPLLGFALALAALSSACASTGQSQEEKALAQAMEAALAPASPEEREAANRADPLTRANFWGKEYQKDPQSVENALQFADALRAIGSQERAKDVVNKTLILHPGNADLMMVNGRILMSEGNYEAARASFEQVTRAAPDRADGWAALGTAFDQMEMHRQAQMNYQRALTLEPDRVTTLTNYGLSLLLSGDLAGAEAQLRTAAAQPGAGARVTENLALVIGLQGRFDEMKEVSAQNAPDKVAEQNAALLRGLVQPARTYDALIGGGNTSTSATPGTKRQLRGTLNQ
ncbi:tetratricopeptide repeat protein [Hyphomonas sp. NPDC076900]|uniref:tetratricopeptide repeat protein n=1 Tax=unclassified Hyphomonas TaxID=2630699 RepID=UPI003D055610